ncbi:hypothetical protein [Amycolatopsis minnesotensis]|uniref:Flagellar basal body-associated protein FliL n=1 Tax=Amycolatopsis minnesotensis TaxID=337894 RepID=A0ABN2RDZ3_9PSEU
MSWQEELRKLDEELASGRLSADDYRVRRDQVLSSAVAHGDASAGQGPQQGFAAAPQGPPSVPQGPPPQQQYAQQQQYQQPQQPHHQQPQPSADSTQVIQPVSPPHGVPSAGGDGSAERTQAVPAAWRSQPPAGQGPQPQFSPQQQPGQFQQNPSSPASGFQQPAWNTPDSDLSPPWAGSDFPPIAAPGSSEWVKQGPESFDTETKPKKGKRTAIIAGSAVVVLAVAAILFFTVFNKKDEPANNNAGGETTSQPAPPPPTSRQAAGLLVIPDGEGPGSKTYTPDQLASVKPLPEPDLVQLKATGVTQAQSVLSNSGSTTESLWAFTTASPQDLMSKFVADQERFGFTEVTAAAQQTGVKLYTSQQMSNDKKVVVFRGHYVADGKVIRVEAFDVNSTMARQKYDALLKDQLAHTPAAR